MALGFILVFQMFLFLFYVLYVILVKMEQKQNL